MQPDLNAARISHSYKVLLDTAQSNGVPAIKRLVEISAGHSSQCGVVARFLASVYNPSRFHFAFDEFRSLDTAIHVDCLAVLSLDWTAVKEIHHYVDDGGAVFENMIADWKLEEKK
jgi:hypothetical protein